MTNPPAQDSPARRGYRMPAEWEPHSGCWFSWPHNRETWPDGLAPVEAAFVAMAAALAPTETVHLNVLDAGHERHVASLLAGAGVSGNVRLHRIPTNDAWCRDHGPLFLVGAGQPLLALDCRYNAWGGKYPPFDRDDAAAAAMAAALGCELWRETLVLEGGSVDVNGAGAVLTTEQCLLNPNRNPQLSRGDIEQRLCALLGVEQVIWLGEGIVGDDTDGHIDDITRFVAPDRVVTVVESDPQDSNYAALRGNRSALAEVRLAGNRPLEILELPMPAPLFHGQTRLPASYANFYVGNGVVLLPAFDDPMDEEAVGVLRHCFPGRQVVKVDCRDLVKGLGAVHCLSQQVPAA